MEINRRDFVKLLGGSLLGFAVGGAGEALLKIPGAVIPMLYKGPRIESWKMTTCTRCPGKCGLRIRLIDKFPVQAFGNTLSPVNKGGVCPMGLTSVESLYHPERLTSPMKKVNGRFQEISYSEAYTTLAKALNGAGKGKTAFAAQTDSVFMGSLIAQLMSGVGSAKYSAGDFAQASSKPYDIALKSHPEFIDFSRCDFIVSFGSQMTEISESPLYFSRALNEFKSKRNEFVSISPKLTPSSYKASRWLPVTPEFYEDIALSLAYVMLSDGTYDKAFTAKEFKDFDGFRKLVLEDYSPDKVQTRTGVDPKYIIETARKFAKAAAPAAYFDESIFYSTNGSRNAYAVIALNALKGFAGYGKMKRQELPGFAESEKDQPSSPVWNPGMLAGDKEVSLLMIYRSNFIFNYPNQDELKKAVSGIPLVVSFSPFIDETSELADIVIPDHDDLEKLDAFASTVTGTPVISTQQPVVEPFYSTRHTGDVLVSLIGDLKLAKNWRYKNYESFLQTSLNPVYKQGKGMLMNQDKPTGLEKSLHQAGWQMASYSSFDEFWEQMLKYGGWWDPFPEIAPFTPVSGITNEKLSKEERQSGSNGSARDGSLRLNVFNRNFDYKGNMLRNPVLSEQFGMDRDVYYDTWIEINPDTARRLSLADRKSVTVKTSRGSFKALAIFNPAVMPASIDVPFGLGHTASGKTYGVNPVSLSDAAFDGETGLPSLSGTIVKIS